MEPHLSVWGYGPWFSHAFARLDRPDLIPARVVADLGPQFEVVDATGASRAAQSSGRLRHTAAATELPAVGDWVAIAAPAGGDTAIIHAVLPRRTCLVRRAAGRADREQVVAANVDTLFVITSANADASPRRIERYLTAAWDSGAAPVIVVSKIDLVEPAELAGTLAALAAVAPGVPIAGISAHTGAGLDELTAWLQPGHTVALVGSSGVGKSSLVNRWLGRDHQVVLPIDDNDLGRHATSHRELFVLPGGALVIDTPGMRSFGLLDTGAGLDEAFADIATIAAGCRFRDCRHQGEPGCAVEAAVEAGELDAARRDGLAKLERELAAAERRRDPVLAHKERAQLRARNRAWRARSRADPKCGR